MKKWFRWQGLIIFGVFSSLLIVFWFFGVDMIVKRSIEKSGTRVVGAKVELAEADVRLFPLGITLNSLQVTNPDSPMSNAFEVRRIDFSLDTLNLMRRKIIIDTMAMEGVRFNTPRKISGAVALKAQEQAPSATSSDTPSAAPGLPSIDIPDVNDILASEKLDSLDQANHLRAEIDAVKTGWQNRLADAPDQKTFEQYQARVNKLKKDAKGISGALTVANDLKKLHKDVSADLEQLSDLQKDLNRDTGDLKHKLVQLKSAPQQDIDRILNTYNLSADGLGNVSQLLFGNKIGSNIQKAIFWYGKLIPFLEKTGSNDEKSAVPEPERGQGVNVRFKETDPLPDLLARQVLLSMIIPAGDMKGEIRQITSDQEQLGLPLEFDFSGDRLEGIQSINIKGTLDHVQPGNSRDRMRAAVKQYRVKDLKLSESADLPILLKNGLAHLNLTASLQEDVLDADIEVIVDAVALEVGKEAGGNQLQRALQTALADVSRFSINAKVAGPLDNYGIRLTSDLDRLLKNAVGRQIKDLTNEFQDKLQAGIMDKVKGPMADASGSMSGLDSINREIESRLKLGNEVSSSLLETLGGKSKLKF